MPTPNQLQAPEFTQTPHATHGEIANWLQNEAVGNSPFAATYLAHLRDMHEKFKDSANAELSEAVIGLTAVIAARSEGRLKDVATLNGGSLPVEIPGVEPLHTVHDEDIYAAAADVMPDDPSSESYEGSFAMAQAHNAIAEATAAELQQMPHGPEVS
ncbi:MAG TPA: hypothetical protein VFH39_04320 [Candidatus Saccharimonadales bacterium]|nr:hypothetical protein [Candidatus Saccharimonadales bacterium]